MIKIDKNIPIPEENRGRKNLYPFKKMKIGDSILIKGKTSGQCSGQLAFARRKYKISLTARTVEDGTRVWRIK